MDTHTATAVLACIDNPEQEPAACHGQVQYRTALSGTGRSFPRCARHWDRRLRLEEDLRDRYPNLPPADWSPDDIGETWDDADY